jgi:hypothetical protein
VCAGHTVWIHNKVDAGSYTLVAATPKNEEGPWNWSGGIAQEGDWAHNGYSLLIPDNVESYWLVFSVSGSTEDDKWRGPINNDGDKCWHFHGHLDSWEIWEC